MFLLPITIKVYLKFLHMLLRKTHYTCKVHGEVKQISKEGRKCHLHRLLPHRFSQKKNVMTKKKKGSQLAAWFFYSHKEAQNCGK